MKSTIKSWTEVDQGFLIEYRAMEGGVSLAEWYEVDDVYTISESNPAVIDSFADVFEWPAALPQRSIEHHIHFKMGTDPVNVRPYRYAFH